LQRLSALFVANLFFMLAGNDRMSGRQREFHPEPLTEPYLIVSHHTVPVIQISAFHYFHYANKYLYW